MVKNPEILEDSIPIQLAQSDLFESKKLRQEISICQGGGLKAGDISEASNAPASTRGECDIGNRVTFRLDASKIVGKMQKARSIRNLCWNRDVKNPKW